ncbi:o-succinylbenzoate--CoA ligase [Aciduricibacillus chroicocephali]|uniref:2-succinylbenzoate--CoA ligase n=1 Tax=Aciduricibacillus chroicocephali TaxID=3054939 RepID=A0ABY9KSZ6_9BACI|nr:o-succinylbenzoate--CoA ligase [Bacillaceae bacterium 44XB]
MSEKMLHWLDKQAELMPDGIAIEEPGLMSLTFKELQTASRTFARRLAGKGIGVENKVAILSDNCPEYIVAVHAISYLGAIAVLLNTRLSEAEITWQLADAKVDFVLMDEVNKGKTESHKWRSQFSNCHFGEIGPEDNAVMLKREIDLKEGFTLMYTSGTTGHPKAVLHTFGNHWWSAIGSMLNLGLTHQDKWLSVLPMFHIGGLSIYLKSVIYGMPVHMLRKFEEKAVLHAILEGGVTIMSAVTVMLRRILEELDEKSCPSSFRCMLLGGGPVPKPLLEKAKEQSIPVFQSYGMTETSSQIVTLSPADALEKLGSSGKPLFPAQLQINEPDQNGEGEIVVKGPMVVSGYYGNVEASHKAITENGWLKTGDIGRLDEGGFLFVLDRRKDLIISGGENIYPAELESVLSTHPKLREVGVVGLPDSKWGQVPAAFFVCRNESLDEQELVQFCYEKLARFKRPKYFFEVKELPRNASGKLLRSKLVEIAHEMSRKKR